MKLRNKIALGTLATLAVLVGCLALVLSHTSACGPAPAGSGSGDQMEAIRYHCYGPPDVLSLEQVDKPVPGADEVLVKVRAASVNPLDWHYMRGSPYLMRLGAGLGAPDDPRLGVDFAGTVEAVGANVSRFRPGDAVFGGAGGAFADYLVIGRPIRDAKDPRAAATRIASRRSASSAVRSRGWRAS